MWLICQPGSCLRYVGDIPISCDQKIVNFKNLSIPQFALFSIMISQPFRNLTFDENQQTLVFRRLLHMQNNFGGKWIQTKYRNRQVLEKMSVVGTVARFWVFKPSLELDLNI